MTLHEQKELFKEAVTITAQRMNLPEIYVEKDYWVTLALHRIYNSAIGAQVIFKGGTALSKCFTFLKQFSEDIDLVILRKPDETGNQLKEKLKQITNVVSEIMPEINTPGVTNKIGMIRKTAHSYNRVFDGEFGQVKDIIIVEASWLGNFEPYTSQKLSSFIFEMMQQTGQQKLAGEFELLPFDVLVLHPKRTLCEKIMSLVRFSYSLEPIYDLRNKIRHCYDLHQLLQDTELLDFFYSKDFDEMLLKVANDDVVSYKSNNIWLQFHPGNAKIFAELETVWEQLKATYNGDFKNLVFGDFPEEGKAFQTLKRIKERLVTIEWEIDISIVP